MDIKGMSYYVNPNTRNVFKLLGDFGIDTSRDFTVKRMKYSRDEKGRIVSKERLDEINKFQQNRED